MSRLLNQNQYAKLCGVTRSAIGKRIKLGTLAVEPHITPNGVKTVYIDADAHPPERYSAGRKKKGDNVANK